MQEALSVRNADNPQVAENPGMLTVNFHQRLGSFSMAVEFQVPLGLIVLFGPSGAGKSLTLRALAGLLQPAHGHISIAGQVLLDSKAGINLPPQQRRVGYVPQHYALFPHLSVAENIAFGLPKNPSWIDWRTRRKAQQTRVAELLAALELEELARRLPASLSGGQQQRVALARALAAQPRLLLLDEPFNALDATVRERLRDALRQFQRHFLIPIVLVTHDRTEAQQLADTVITLIQGRVAQIGSSEDIFRTPHTEAIARLVGQHNFFKGHLANPPDHQQPAPRMALRLESLSASHAQRQTPTPQIDESKRAWLPLPAHESLTSPLLTPQTTIAGCIQADEILVRRWTEAALPPIWTTKGNAQWLAELVDAQPYERAMRLLMRPLWAGKPIDHQPDAAHNLEVYLSRQQWREIDVAPGQHLLLEISPSAIHCFETPTQDG